MQHLWGTVDRVSVTAPRALPEDQIIKVTCRCVNRGYRLTPTPEVVEILEFCLAHVSQKFRDAGQFELYGYCFMSTHYHLTLRDIGGCVSKLLQNLNSLLSRNVNALRGSRGTNFAPDPGIQTVIGADRVLESMAYDEANPIAAGIVVKSEAWGGRDVGVDCVRRGKAGRATECGHLVDEAQARESTRVAALGPGRVRRALEGADGRRAAAGPTALSARADRW